MIETISSSSTLADRLRERISTRGPITFCDWMRSALYDPHDGFYCRPDRNKWGRDGDYRTSPERSSLFAATFARYFAQLYDKLDRPARWTILEAGAGDGHFASVVLQTLEKFFPEVFAATHYVIDEVSLNSRTRARERLQSYGDRVAFKRLEETSIDPGIVFSNELLDAFPVHRVTVDNGRLCELYVDVGGDGRFVWKRGALSTRAIAEYFEECGIELGEGQIAEVNLETEEWLKKLAGSVRKGFVITVDYGADAADLYPSSAADPRYFGTLRSFQRHQIIDDVLLSPGEQDLTTTVNWSFVRSVGETLGFKVIEFERQDRFLLSAGLLEQLHVESQHTRDEAETLRLSTASREMIFPDGMASHFQVLVQYRSPTVRKGSV
jgi:SAM-dependent MidA family methyltransferase